MVADDDEVRLEQATALYRGLPDAELAAIPDSCTGSCTRSPPCAIGSSLTSWRATGGHDRVGPARERGLTRPPRVRQTLPLMAASEDDQLAIPADPIRIVAECPTLHL